MAFSLSIKDKAVYNKPCTYVPSKEAIGLIGCSAEQPAIRYAKEEEKLVKEVLSKALNLEPTITAEKPVENQAFAN